MNKGQFHNAESQEAAENLPTSELGTRLQHALHCLTQAQSVQAAVMLQVPAHDIALPA